MKNLVVWVVLLLLCSSIIVVAHSNEKSALPSSSGNILYVGGSGPENYSTIQAAINNSTAGDTVFVYAHTLPYYERLIIPHAINLIGENKNATIIDGQGHGHVITVQSDYIKITGFTIQNGGGANQGNGVVLTNHSNCIVSGNIFRKNNFGILLSNSTNNTIEYNTASENAFIGIVLGPGSIDNRVIGNTITNNTNHGIYVGISIFQPTPQPDRNIIIGNTIEGNNDGIFLWCAQHTLVCNNTILYSKTFDGVWVLNSENNTILENIIMKNKGAGIHFDNVDGPFNNNIVIRNTLAGNLESGVHIDSHIGGIIIYQNNFFNNGRNGYDNWSNQWDNGPQPATIGTTTPGSMPMATASGTPPTISQGE